jgi:hypothetical protein
VRQKKINILTKKISERNSWWRKQEYLEKSTNLLQVKYFFLEKKPYYIYIYIYIRVYSENLDVGVI